jgi:hypothetical protein
MSYKGEPVDREGLKSSEPEAKKSAGDRPSTGKQVVTYTLVGTLTLGVLPHALECITRDAPGGLVCESKAPKRHDLHIEAAPNSSNTSTGVQIFTLMSDSGSPSVADAFDLFIRPRSG